MIKKYLFLSIFSFLSFYSFSSNYFRIDLSESKTKQVKIINYSLQDQLIERVFQYKDIGVSCYEQKIIAMDSFKINKEIGSSLCQSFLIPKKIEFLEASLLNDENNVFIDFSLDDEKIEVKIGNFFEVELKGYSFIFVNSHTSPYAIMGTAEEIENGEYDLENFYCEAGDVMVDIGAHIGMTSILYAKMYPQLKIYAFEPDPGNYIALLRNIKMNNISNIIPINKAVTCDGEPLSFSIYPFWSACGCSDKLSNSSNKTKHYLVESIKLEDIFKQFNIEKCRFLKIDCEGSEYEILYNTPKEIFEKIEYLAGEFHINDILEKHGHSSQALLDYCLMQNKNIKHNIKQVRCVL